MHDIGKPHCYQDDGEVRHFRGHAQKSAEISKDILKRLEIDDRDASRILYLIENQLPFNSNIRSSMRVKQLEKRHFVDPSIATSLLNMTVDMIEDVSPFDRYVPDIQNTIDTL